MNVLCNENTALYSRYDYIAAQGVENVPAQRWMMDLTIPKKENLWSPDQ